MRTYIQEIFRLQLILITIVIFSPAWTQAETGDYDFLEQYEDYSVAWTPEVTPVSTKRTPPLAIDLAPFYRDFIKDGEVSLSISYGYEAFTPSRARSLFNMMVSLASHYGLRIGNWQFNGSAIQFIDLIHNIKYRVTINGDRENFIQALAKNEIVLYNGHSRYGRGPTFGNFWNYFRMGDNFKTIEVDTRNPYFQTDPMQLTDTYPPQRVNLGGGSYEYQYRGQKLFSSYLPQDSYTKNIPGLDTDLRRAAFYPGRQIVYLYSCKNIEYWKKPLRNLLPDANQKFIFGTDDDGYGGTKPDAVMIMSIVRRIANSNQVLRELNATGDCNNCFTSY